MKTQDSNWLSADSVTLLTRHGKELVIAPELEAGGVLTLAHTDAFDTDTLGTFSGEVERRLSPLDCARYKARLACELTGASIGLGSEGSFGGGPMAGLIGWDHELLVLVDTVSGLEVVATAQGPFDVHEWEADDAAALRAGLEERDPQQGWLLQADDFVAKGLYTADAILAAAGKLFGRGAESALAAGAPFPWPLPIKPDLRAMHCPPRRARIREAAANLRQRLLSFCPGCSAPNFWPDHSDYGLPCGACGFATRCLRQKRAVCFHCKEEQCYPVPESHADPGRCDFCNP